MNDLLGGKKAGEGDALANLPKIEAETPERAPAMFPLGVTEATVSVAGKLTTQIAVSEAGQRNAFDV